LRLKKILKLIFRKYIIYSITTSWINILIQFFAQKDLIITFVFKLFATTNKSLFRVSFTAFTDSWAKIWNNRFNGIGPQENHFLVFGLLNEPKSSKTSAAKHTIYRNTRLSCFLKIIEFIKISFQTSHLNSYSDKSNKLW
jgi:hypothetical protein